MSKLQSDFTTSEQSKRLLELGVPADSANCYLTRFGIDENWEVKMLNNVKYSEISISNQKYCLPCWSVGRLIEILKECINNEDDLIDIFVELQYSNDILTTILMIFRDNKAILDFSKLEE